MKDDAGLQPIRKDVGDGVEKALSVWLKTVT